MTSPSNRSSSPDFSRIGLLAGAGALIVYGLTRRTKTSIALATAGGYIAYKQATAKEGNTLETARAVFQVNASTEDAYRLWRDFTNLPRFMAHLVSVRVLDDRRSEWVAEGPLNSQVRWQAEITEDQPNRRIAWRSLPDSQITTEGHVAFSADPLGRGSFVEAEVRYANPLGPLAKGLVTALGKNPQFVVKEDLRRFKSLLEAGEAPTTVGQPNGVRGIHGSVGQIMFRETSNHPLPQAS